MADGNMDLVINKAAGKGLGISLMAVGVSTRIKSVTAGSTPPSERLTPRLFLLCPPPPPTHTPLPLAFAPTHGLVAQFRTLLALITVVGDLAGSPAASAGVEVGDEVIAVDGSAVKPSPNTMPGTSVGMALVSCPGAGFL